jgi:hypothetical protein
MSGVKLFGRAWNVVIGTLDLGGLDLAFSVKKTLKPEPNTCDLRLFNLSPAHRKQIEQQGSNSQTSAGKVPVSIKAGYGNSLAQIFLGELRAAGTITDGADIVTELSTGDGEHELATARLNISLGPGTPINLALREVLATLGIGEGNLTRALALLQSKGILQFSAKAQILKGNAADYLTDITKAAGLEWSIQNGAAQFLLLGQPLAGTALKLNSSTGLVGSPSVDSKGTLSFSTLLIPGLQPGTLVVMDAKHVKGNFRVVMVESQGDSLGNEWGHKCQASKF